MHSVHLNIHDSVYDHFMKFLGKFKNHEIVIVATDGKLTPKNNQFERTKAELQADFEDMNSGNSKSYTIEELEKSLDQIIAKYEAHT